MRGRDHSSSSSGGHRGSPRRRAGRDRTGRVERLRFLPNSASGPAPAPAAITARPAQRRSLRSSSRESAGSDVAAVVERARINPVVRARGRGADPRFYVGRTLLRRQRCIRAPAWALRTVCISLRSDLGARDDQPAYWPLTRGFGRTEALPQWILRTQSQLGPACTCCRHACTASL
jgi:hypothetical protein